ncbi:MAG: hypothetical protein BWY09_00470 [Candidatus Hydrogenedentes bacterium ADurb.Bin179]|nr:MAG: hypothetical protein BWY09_00470 [Candidatus Hydrogenedentes bacterium ADurb.Bin179]
MNLIDESSRGFEARKMLENPLFVECLATMRDSITAKWRSAPIRDREGMHELKLMDKILTDFETYFRTLAETGKMADIQLEQEQKLLRLRKSGIR